VTDEKASPSPSSDTALNISRRDALSMLAGAAIGSGAIAAEADSRAPPSSSSDTKNFRIRTLTAGIAITNFAETDAVKAALDFLATARRRFEGAGYVVQTTRVALNPLLAGASPAARVDALPRLAALDALAASHGALISIGPVFSAGDADETIGAWAQQLVRATKVLSFSGSVASLARGVPRSCGNGSASDIGAHPHRQWRHCKLSLRCLGMRSGGHALLPRRLSRGPAVTGRRTGNAELVAPGIRIQRNPRLLSGL
jgi:hypothetical protein